MKEYTVEYLDTKELEKTVLRSTIMLTMIIFLLSLGAFALILDN